MSEDMRVEFVSSTDADPAELDALTRALRAEILEVDEVNRVEQASAGPAPEEPDGRPPLRAPAPDEPPVRAAPGAGPARWPVEAGGPGRA